MIEIVHELRLAKGSNKKKEILRKHVDNEPWKKVLLAMYDSSINYYTGCPNDFTFTTATDYSTMLDDLKQLTQRQLTGNAAKTYAIELSRKYGELLRLVLDGSLKCGVSIKILNDVYPGLIPTFPLMKGDHYDIIKLPILCSIKYDGVRIVANVAQGKVTLQTSSGKCVYIGSLIHNLASQSDGVYDGELVAGDGKQVGRSKITGQLNKCLFGTATDMTEYTYCIFDKVSLDEWDKRESHTSFYDRLMDLWAEFVPGPHIMLVQHRVIPTIEGVDGWYQHLLSLGFEGLIGRYYENVYVWKRSEAIIKQKATRTVVLTCVSTLPGEGKYEGMIGALHCEGGVEGQDVVVKVGSGLSDWDRDQEEKYFVGKEVEVMYNTVTLAEGADYHSLFLPRFKRVYGRTDT